jgi:hypothetical protein
VVAQPVALGELNRASIGGTDNVVMCVGWGNRVCGVENGVCCELRVASRRWGWPRWNKSGVKVQRSRVLNCLLVTGRKGRKGRKGRLAASSYAWDG